MIFLFLGLLHCLLCAVLTLLIRCGILHTAPGAMVLAWCVPVWGAFCVLRQEMSLRLGGGRLREVDLEPLKIEDEVYQSIPKEDEEEKKRIVPLEEALLMNDFSVRRSLLMDAIYENPGDYVYQLREACMNEDTEVVHYAVTALAELQKEYTLRFQRLDREMARKPDDGELEDAYLQLLEQYLDSGFPEGSTRRIYLRSYSDMLEKKLKRDADLTFYCKKIETDFHTGDYDAAYRTIERVLEMWPGKENGYLLLIRYYALVKDRGGINRVLDMISEKGIYLSLDGRNAVRFWSTGGEEA